MNRRWVIHSHVNWHEPDLGPQPPPAPLPAGFSEDAEMARSPGRYRDASMGSQDLEGRIVGLKTSAKSKRVRQLEKRVRNREVDIQMWRESYEKAVEGRDEALLREERAQWMRIGAETRLKDLEIEYSQALCRERQKDEDHAKEVARLKEAETGVNLGKASRLKGRIDEMIKSLDDVYVCGM